MLPQCLCAIGPTRPVTLFTFVVLLSCIIFSFFGLCLKKLQPRKPSSYQVSPASHPLCYFTSVHPLLACPEIVLAVPTKAGPSKP